MTTLLLSLTAITLAGPAPRLALSQTWLRRTPIATLVWWQSVAAAAVLAALGAGLSLATDSVWQHTPTATGWLVAGLALTLTAVVFGRLALSGHRVGTNLRALRRRHRDQLDVLAARTSQHPSVSLVDSDVPVAYCLPQLRASRIVVTSGAQRILGAEGMAAVLAHEVAHVRARHDLVLEAFMVLQHAFPRIGSSRWAREEVGLLLEMAADRRASRETGPVAVARALSHLAAGRSPEGSLGVDGAGLLERIERLTDPRQHLLQAAAVVLVAWFVLAAPTWWIVRPWLTSLGW